MKNKIMILLAMVMALPAFAQSNKVVQWNLIVKMTSATAGEAIVKGSIDPGWHMYGIQLPKGGPTPTSVDFAKSQGVTFIGKPTVTPAPTNGHDQLFGMNLSWWEGNIVFRQKFTITPNADKKAITCVIKYIACNNQRCSMPTTEILTKPVKK